MTGQRADLERVARTWLPAAVADQFMGLVRPAIRLFEPGPDDQPVGQLGGRPSLPADMPWPRWADDEPLSFAFGVELDRLAGIEIDIGLPAAGSLLVFRPGVESEPEDPDLGTRLIYLPPDTPVSGRPTPPGVESFPLWPLAARPVLTWPDKSEPVLISAFGSFDEARRLVWSQQHDGEYFDTALCAHQERFDPGYTGHQIGGYSDTVQNSIVYQATGVALGHYRYDDPTFAAQAAMWTSLLQLGEDPTGKLFWGDGGLGHFAIRKTDLSAHRFDRVYFESQGH